MTMANMEGIGAYIAGNGNLTKRDSMKSNGIEVRPNGNEIRRKRAGRYTSYHVYILMPDGSFLKDDKCGYDYLGNARARADKILGIDIMSAEEWNRRYPVGQSVSLKGYDEFSVETETVSIAWESDSGKSVVMLRGYTSPKMLEAIKIKENK